MALTLVNDFDLRPVFVCDHCHKPITIPSGLPTGGLVLWQSTVDDGVVTIGRLYFVHQGRCDQRFDPEHNANSLELFEFLDLLTRNTMTSPAGHR